MNLDEAERMLGAAKAKASEMGVAVSIAVVDNRGDVVALARLDGARYFTADIARGKAIVSATVGQTSAALAEMGSSPIFQRINGMNQNRMIFHQGAVPVTQDGKLIGAIGVSGASSTQDEEIASAGAAALEHIPIEPI
jgi:uncharacterized protein GlcG (DUF336 family)